MNIRYSIMIVGVGCIVMGALFFLIQQRWLVIHWSFCPSTEENFEKSIKGTITKKDCSIYSFKDDKEHIDIAQILWEEANTTHNAKELVGHWLIYQQEERIVNQSLSLENVAFSNVGQALYLSFNQPMMGKDWSTFKKWRILESLLKTIRSSGLSITIIRFLINDEPMEDEHLDFSQDFPVAGFDER